MYDRLLAIPNKEKQLNKLFTKFIEITKKIAIKNKENVDRFLKIGNEILEVYKKQSYIRETPLNMLNFNNYSFIPIIEYLLDNRSDQGNILSPMANEKNSEWILENSFCFFNVRATSNKKGELGNLIDAIKILPALRVKSIHLAPFFESSLGV